MKLVDAIREKQGRLSALKAEIAQLETELREASALLAGGAVRVAAPPRPKLSRHGFTNGKRSKPIQSGSSVDWAKRLLQEAGRPMHIDTIIETVSQRGGPTIKKPTLVSNLSRYVRHGDTFIRTAESTYGLVGRDKPVDEQLAWLDAQGQG